MNMRALSDLVGHAEPVNPEHMQFVAHAVKGTSCYGCVFDGQRSPVCFEAGRIAVRAGLPDCDAGFVYVLKPADPRQLTIV